MLFGMSRPSWSWSKPEKFPESTHYIFLEYPFACHKISPDENEMKQQLEWLEKMYDDGLLLLECLPPYCCLFLKLYSKRR